MRLFSSPHWTRCLQVSRMALVVSAMLASLPLLAQTQGKERPMERPTFYRTAARLQARKPGEVRVGDRVRLCLVSFLAGCPAGDDRGHEYTATNLRTHETWKRHDASHMCGGA